MNATLSQRSLSAHSPFAYITLAKTAKTGLQPALSNMFNMEQTQMCQTSFNAQSRSIATGKCGSLPSLGLWSDEVLQVNDGEKSVFHLIWYILIGLISGVIAKSVMHVHMTIFWTIVLGIIGSILGGAVTHMFSRPANERYHPAGLIFSTLGAILILFVCYKLNIRFPTPNLAFR
jgi:uncharacterized membrane protein YeaQ/YmgE (transglycosylase-associated protein family)